MKGLIKAVVGFFHMGAGGGEMTPPIPHSFPEKRGFPAGQGLEALLSELKAGEGRLSWGSWLHWVKATSSSPTPSKPLESN